MNTLIHADIFFFITAIVVIIIGAIVAIGAGYIVVILSDLKYIVKKIRTESDLVSDDIADIRSRIKDEGGKMGGIVRSVAMFFIGKMVEKGKKKRSSKHHDEDSDE
jgi:predicted PurR-regulated permease PerM